MNKRTATNTARPARTRLALITDRPRTVRLHEAVVEALAAKPQRRTVANSSLRLPDAACANTPVNAFYTVGSERREEAARRACLGCPELVKCMIHGLKHEAYGIWGGLTEAERHYLGDPKDTTSKPAGLSRLRREAPKVDGATDMRSRAAASAITSGVRPAALATALRAVHQPAWKNASAA